MVKVSYDVINQCYSAVFRIRTSLTTYKNYMVMRKRNVSTTYQNYIVMRKGMGQQHIKNIK